MREKPAVRIILPLWLLFAVVTPLTARADRYRDRQGSSAAGQEEEASFSLTRLPEDPKRYGLVVSGPNERILSGSFTVDQLQILRAIMVEAEKFALTAEAVSPKDPITTRFADKRERAFIVDVQKIGNQSLMFLTLRTEQGRLTLDVGRIIRSTRREEGLFFDLLSRLESVLPKAPAQAPK